MLTIGNDELGNAITINAECPNCHKRHKVLYGNKVEKDGSLTPSKMLAFVKCPVNDNSYLIGIDGKELKYD